MVKGLLLIQYIIIQIKRASIRIFHTFIQDISDLHHRGTSLDHVNILFLIYLITSFT